MLKNGAGPRAGGCQNAPCACQMSPGCGLGDGVLSEAVGCGVCMGVWPVPRAADGGRRVASQGWESERDFRKPTRNHVSSS